MQDLGGIVPLGRDEAVEGVLGYGDEAAEVERHRIHRQALAAVVKHGVSERGVVPEHLVAHCVTFRLAPYHRRHSPGAERVPGSLRSGVAK
jgi:hypothetical protein